MKEHKFDILTNQVFVSNIGDFLCNKKNHTIV